MTRKSTISSLSIFMPAYNEEGNIAATIIDARLAAEQLSDDFEIIVVDDGSHDRTQDIVKELSHADDRIKLVKHSKNLGYGAAVKTGLKSCTKDWIFFTDSDGQFHYDELPEFATGCQDYDLIIGYRQKRMDPFHRVFVAQVLLKIWNYLLFKLKVRDVDCAFKLFKRQVRDAIKLETQSAITVTEFIVKAQALGFKILERPVHHFPRKFGEQTGGNWRVILKAARESLVLHQKMAYDKN